MNSIRGFHTTIICYGRPFKRRNSLPIIHAAEKPAAKADIDFSALDLKYPIVSLPELVIESHVWAPKPKDTPQLPFFIERTEVGLSLPVYTAYRTGNTRVLTILRKIKGDVYELKSDMEKVVGKEVSVRPGKLIVEGNYHRRVKLWLLGLGF